MKKAVLLLAGIFFTLAAAAQQKTEVTIGNGVSTRDVREITDFDKLEVKGPFEIRLVSGEAGSVIIEGEKNLTGMITTQVNDNTLTIAPQEGRLFKSSSGNKIIIKVPFTILHEVTLKGSGTITGKKAITDNVMLFVEGSGSIVADVTGNAAEAVVNGSGKILLSGKSESLIANVNGSGTINAANLAYNSASIHVTGSGSAIAKNNEIIKSSNGVVTLACATPTEN